MNLSDVFNEAQLPVVTFVQPKEFLDIIGSIGTAGKHITLCGPSGCGKTTLAKKALEKACVGIADCHWMTGRRHTDAPSVEAMFAKEFGCGQTQSEVEDFLRICGILVIDDFHHLPSVLRDEIGRRLKLWHENGIRLFVIGIAETAHHLMNIDSELGIRNDPYEMKTQNTDFISMVIGLGESALNIAFAETTKDEFIRASNGIPSAIQVICRVACLRSSVFERQEDLKTIDISMKNLVDGVLRSYQGKYYSKVVGLAKGKQRSRSVHDTYLQIVQYICKTGDSEISVEDLQREIVQSESDPAMRSKKNTSFYNCLQNLQDVIKRCGLSDALYYDTTARAISIEDPSFRLYLSLMDVSQLEKAVRSRQSRYTYDVALSFAGNMRPKAEELKNILEDKGYAIFYDFDEQSRLWGTNLRKTLGDVYASQAQFMVVFVSNEYPERDWPSFELEIGRRAKDKQVRDFLLPIRFDDTVVVGLSSDIGHMDARQYSMADIAECLMKKIEETLPE